MIPLFFALLLAQDKTNVVVNALTNEPLRKGHIVLDDRKTRYAVTSGTEGTFRFEGIEPGNYRPEAQRDGFLDASNDPWLEVASGQQVKDIVIKLLPESVIAGHVIDEDGDPIAAAGVSYERAIRVV
ncbi:MAG: carboxypeptidase-like regulatory domain-containing protein [Bryobacteraceae bacterium]